MEKRKVIRKLIKAVSIALGVCLIILYLLPYYWSGIFNIGTVVGLFLSTLLIVCAAFQRQIWALTKRLCESKRGKTVVISLFTVFCICISVFIGTYAVCFFGGRTSATDERTLIVLGCLVKPTRPSDQLIFRIEAAEKYLNEHPDAIAILSGGNGADEPMSEAQCMFEELSKRGIDEKRLYIEDKSKNTRENIAFSKELIEKENLPDDIAIVSNRYHVTRAVLTAKKLGLDTAKIAAYCDLSPVHYTREVIGVWCTIIGFFG